MSSATSAKLPPYQLLDEPALAFSPEDKGKVDIHPLRGLLRYGAFSQQSFAVYTSQIRIATVGPASSFKQRGAFIASLRDSFPPSDRKEYVPHFPGFESLFQAQLVSAIGSAHIKWPEHPNQLPGVGSVQEKLMHAMEHALRALNAVRFEFDVVVFHFPESWTSFTRTTAFDAHDYLKGMAANFNIPTQVINDSAISFRYKASLAWRLSIALYVKAAGTPWKLAPIPGVPDETAYIGLAYAIRSERYVTCCSQVFDTDGGGMQFVAFEAKEPITDIAEARKNPYLNRDDMRAVIARSLNLYLARNSGRLPKRMVIHKTTPFKSDEIDGAFDALSGVPEIECIEININSGWRGVWLLPAPGETPPSKPSNYPVPRGVVLARSGNSALLWGAGNAPGVSTNGDYYQGKKSIPKPLNLVRHAGRGPLDIIAKETLALTKMDWNNDALYDPLPVSIKYSQRLARTIANVPNLPGNIYAYRLFM